MKFLILGLVLTQPLSMYGVHTRFTSGLRHIYAASYGSIHRALRQLEAAGHIRQVPGATTARNTKRYLATAEGTEVWRSWMSQPESTEDTEASTIARVLLLGRLASKSEREEVLLGLRARAVAELDDLRALEASVAERRDDSADSRYAVATVDHGVRSGTEMVTWIEELLDEVALSRSPVVTPTDPRP